MPRLAWYVVACILAGAGVAFWQLQRERAAEEVEADHEALQLELRGRFQVALKAIRANDWKSARAEFLGIAATDPTFEKERVQAYLAASDKELANQAQLDAAEQHLEKGELTAAGRALDQISKETLQFKRAIALRESLERKIKEKLADARVLSFKTNDLGAMTELLALANDVLGAAPQQPDALAFKELAERTLADPTCQVGVPHPPLPPAKQVRSRFEAGDLTGAVASAEACAPKSKECKGLLKDLRLFDKQFKARASATQKQRAAMISLARRITGGGQSELVRELQSDDPNEERIRSLRAVIEMTPPDDEYHLKAQKALDDLKR